MNMAEYLQLIRPEGRRTQRFGKNATSIYAEQGLKGHTAEDWVNGWKSPIKAVVTGEVYSTINLTNKDPKRYRAVYQVVDTEEFSYEISYGHIDQCFANIGDVVKVGQIIATEGNWGDVFSGGKPVTTAGRKVGKGSHLHGPQLRKCIKVKTRTRGKKYLKNAKGYFKRDGKYYEIVDYDNGYWGCIDPAPHYKLTLKQILNIFAILRRFGLLK
jgi:murein DD-endopeptidase MepM/ murein hydrolase activator NlpD